MFGSGDILTLSVIFHDSEGVQLSSISLPLESEEFDIPKRTSYATIAEYREDLTIGDNGLNRKRFGFNVCKTIYIGTAMTFKTFYSSVQMCLVNNEIDGSKVDINKTPILITSNGAKRQQAKKILKADDVVVADENGLRQKIILISKAFKGVLDVTTKIKEL